MAFPRVVIVGGGIAGISAARELRKNGIRDILILEAQGRLGGRIHTVETGDNQLLDLGAQWIHGQEGNPLYALGLEHDLVITDNKAMSTSETSRFYGQGFITESGERVPDELVKEINNFLETLYDECNRTDNQTDGRTKLGDVNETDTGKPTSVGEYYRVKFDEYLAACNDSEEAIEQKRCVFNWRIRWECHDKACVSLHDVRVPTHYETYGGNSNVELKNGFTSLFNVLLDDIAHVIIKTNTQMTKIHWNNESSKKCQVETNSGDVIVCDHVIVTASIGYLQNYMDRMFSPPLPKCKREAISNWGFGNVVKLFLIWDIPFWDNDFQGIQFAWRDYKDSCVTTTEATDKNGELWYRDIEGFVTVKDRRGVLLGWLGGEAADISEGLTSEEIICACHVLLQKFLPYMTITKPTKLQRTRWSSNKYICGAYSYASVFSDPQHFIQLSQPTPSIQNPLIVFAGEATSYSHFSTAHGAFESGIWAAETICSRHFGSFE